MARAQTLKKEPWRKYKTNTSITVCNFLKIDGHTETPLVMNDTTNINSSSNQRMNTGTNDAPKVVERIAILNPDANLSIWDVRNVKRTLIHNT